MVGHTVDLVSKQTAHVGHTVVESKDTIVTFISKNSLQVMDNVVDTYGSSSALLFAWMTYLGCTGTYAALVLDMELFHYQCPTSDDAEEGFGCVLIMTILTWCV